MREYRDILNENYEKYKDKVIAAREELESEMQIVARDFDIDNETIESNIDFLIKFNPVV